MSKEKVCFILNLISFFPSIIIPQNKDDSIQPGMVEDAYDL